MRKQQKIGKTATRAANKDRREKILPVVLREHPLGPLFQVLRSTEELWIQRPSHCMDGLGQILVCFLLFSLSGEHI